MIPFIGGIDRIRLNHPDQNLRADPDRGHVPVQMFVRGAIQSADVEKNLFLAVGPPNPVGDGVQDSILSNSRAAKAMAIDENFECDRRYVLRP